MNGYCMDAIQADILGVTPTRKQIKSYCAETGVDYASTFGDTGYDYAVIQETLDILTERNMLAKGIRITDDGVCIIRREG